MASQPVSGNEYKIIVAAGTTVVSNIPVTLKNVAIGGTFIGSVEFYDSATAAGTAATNLLFSVGLPDVYQYRSVELDAKARTGLVTVATGTPTLTYTIDN